MRDSEKEIEQNGNKQDFEIEETYETSQTMFGIILSGPADRTLVEPRGYSLQFCL